VSQSGWLPRDLPLPQAAFFVKPAGIRPSWPGLCCSTRLHEVAQPAMHELAEESSKKEHPTCHKTLSPPWSQYERHFAAR
jgi:hypothetical protein